MLYPSDETIQEAHGAGYTPGVTGIDDGRIAMVGKPTLSLGDLPDPYMGGGKPPAYAGPVPAVNRPGRAGDGSLLSGVDVVDPETGGAKGQKPERYGLIPVWPLAELARVYGYGAEKYDDNNWRKGYRWGLSYDALQRHINAFWIGENVDPESGLHHLAHAMFHLNTLMTYDVEGLGTDDRS